nr:hypothetical protein [Tanacetum cinerariifolium]
MSNTNNTMQTQTSNTLHNAIMEAGGKDRPPLLAPGNYVQWKSRIKRYIDTKPNHELIQYCLKNPPYKYTWADKDKEIDKLVALSFNKIYKPTNNNLRTSSNTNRANQDNSPRISRGTGYDTQRIVNVIGAKETVEQVNWKDDIDDKPDDQELEAHYMYMAQIQKANPDVADNSIPIFNSEPLQKDDDDNDDDLANELDFLASFIEKLKCKIDDSKKHMKKELFAHQETISILSQAKEAQLKFYKTREDKELVKVIALENKVKVLDKIVYKTGQTVQTMNMLNRNCKTSFAKPEFFKKVERTNPRLYDISCYNDNLALMLAPESEEVI